MKLVQMRLLKVFCAIIFLAACAAAQTANAPEVPQVDGKIGPCQADFTVKDGAGKVVYDAKIDVLIRYGFLSLRKMELEVGTNSDGKARVVGLPSSSKKPLEFQVKSGTVSSTVTDDPSTTCKAVYNVVLRVH